MTPKEFGDLPEGKRTLLLKVLSYREREMLKLLSGHGDGYTYTLEEVGHIFKVPSTLISDVVQTALAKVERYAAREMSESSSAENRANDEIQIAIALPEYCDEEIVATKLVELYVALNGMHIGAGGMGLELRDDQSDAGTLVVEGAPSR